MAVLYSLIASFVNPALANWMPKPLWAIAQSGYVLTNSDHKEILFLQTVFFITVVIEQKKIIITIASLAKIFFIFGQIPTGLISADSTNAFEIKMQNPNIGMYKYRGARSMSNFTNRLLTGNNAIKNQSTENDIILDDLNNFTAKTKHNIMINIPTNALKFKEPEIRADSHSNVACTLNGNNIHFKYVVIVFNKIRKFGYKLLPICAIE